MQARPPEEVVRAALAAFGAGDKEVLYALLHPKATVRVPGEPAIAFAGVYRGGDGLRSFVDVSNRELQVIDAQLDGWLIDGEQVCIYGRAAHQASHGGTTQRGHFMHYYRVADGLIREIELFVDSLALAITLQGVQVMGMRTTGELDTLSAFGLIAAQFEPAAAPPTREHYGLRHCYGTPLDWTAARLLPHCSEQVHWQSPGGQLLPMGGSFSGLSALRLHLERFCGAFPHRQLHIEHWAQAGDQLLVLGEMQLLTAGGRRGGARYAHLLQLEDERICEGLEFYDTAAALHLLGIDAGLLADRTTSAQPVPTG